MKATSKCKAKDPATCRYHGTPVPKPVKPVRTLNSVREGVNVSEFETRFIKTLITQATNPHQPVLPSFGDIPDMNRPKAFQGLTETEIFDLQTGFIKTLRDSLGIPEPELLIVEYSRNNHVGNDFYVKNTNTGVEVKLGGATDLNIGFASVATILGKDSIHLLPNQQDRTIWRETYLTGNGQELIAGLIQAQHNAKVKKFVEHLNNHPPVIGEEGQELLTKYWTRNTNNTEELNRNVKLFQINPTTHTWVVKNNTKDQIGEWVVDRADYTKQNRANIIIINRKLSDVKLRLIMNYKNNYKFPNGLKAPAKLGLNVPSFNGWWVTSSGSTK